MKNLWPKITTYGIDDDGPFDLFSESDLMGCNNAITNLDSKEDDELRIRYNGD